MNGEWVKTEIADVRQKEVDQGKRVLFTISLVPFKTIRAWKNFDADWGKDSAREIQEYYIPDFSDWKNQDKYQIAFEHLVRDLRVENKLQEHLDHMTEPMVPQALTPDNSLEQLLLLASRTEERRCSPSMLMLVARRAATQLIPEPLP